MRWPRTLVDVALVSVALVAPLVGCGGKAADTDWTNTDAANPTDAVVPSERDAQGTYDVRIAPQDTLDAQGPTLDAQEVGQDTASTRDTGSTIEPLRDAPADQVDVGPDGRDPFCSGTTPKVMLRGMEGPAWVIGASVLPLSCCNAVAIEVGAAVTEMPISVMWRSEGGPTAESERTSIDLSAPPEGWGVSVEVGCRHTTSSCVSTYSYTAMTSSMQGRLEVLRLQGTLHSQTTLCLTAAGQADAASGTPAIRVYLPQVATSY